MAYDSIQMVKSLTAPPHFPKKKIKIKSPTIRADTKILEI